MIRNFKFDMAGHSRPKDGVASLAYVPAIHALLAAGERRGCPAQGRAWRGKVGDYSRHSGARDSANPESRNLLW